MTDREKIRTVALIALEHGLRSDERIIVDDLLAEAREKAPGVTIEQACEGMRMATRLINTAIATGQPQTLQIQEAH
jgi:hypothetical protein